MSCCSPNTLFIDRPTRSMADECAACNNSGSSAVSRSININDPVAFCQCNGRLGPRRNREKVREQIKDFVLLSLGAPVVSIEMDDQQLDAAVDYALQIYEDYAPREFYNYYVFNTTPGQSVYTMPPDIGLIRNVFYKEQPGLFFNSSDLGGVLPIEYYYPGGAYSSMQGGLMDPNQPIYGRMGEWVLYKQYEQMYSRLSSQIGGWEWVDGYCNIKLYPTPCRCNSVIVHYLQKRPDFREVREAMQVGALAWAKQMLGRVRSKYTNIPGPEGGVQLDGFTLIDEGKEEWTQWKEDLIYRYGDIPPITMD